MQKERYIKAVDRRNNRVVFINEARWTEYRASGWFDSVDALEYVYMARCSDASGVPVFVQKEKELFWTDKVEVL